MPHMLYHDMNRCQREGAATFAEANFRDHFANLLFSDYCTVYIIVNTRNTLYDKYPYKLPYITPFKELTVWLMWGI